MKLMKKQFRVNVVETSLFVFVEMMLRSDLFKSNMFLYKWFKLIFYYIFA